jgi:small-conductance mechanosensitive channel
MKFPKILLILFFANLIVVQAQDQSVQTAPSLSSSSLEISEEEQQPATFVYQNRDIITFRAKINGVSPQQRVNKALARLEQLPDLALTEPIQVSRIKEGFLVFVGSHFIFGIAPQDLDPSGSEMFDQVSQRAVANLKAALLAQSEQKNPQILLRGAVFSLLATFIFLVILALFFRIRARLLDYFSRKAETSAKMHVFGLDLKNTARILFQMILRLALFSLALLTAYVWLAFVFRQFPYTYPWGVALRAFFWNSAKGLATGFARAIPALLTVFIIFAVARIITRLIRDFFNGVEQRRINVPGIYAETAGATRRMINALIWLLALVIAYPYIPGSQTAAFKGVSVFVGLMFTLGSAGVLNHLMSGLVLVYSRALQKGDFVKVGEVEGTVDEVGPLSVKIATIDRKEVTIPNTVMTNTNIINYTRMSKEKGLILRTTVTIGYGYPWRQVHAMLKLAASRTQGLRKDTEPFVLQTTLSDFYVEYTLCVAIENPRDRIRILSELHANIQDAFNEYGVQILTPHFEGQPEATVVVPKSKWFSAPADQKNE